MVSLQNFLQLDDYNGVPLAAGKVYVYHQGRETLAEIYADINGETPIANPAILNSLGMQEIYVSNVYNYTVVVTDPYNNELFSRDIYPNGVDGDGNNRLYEGLDPICVNNDKMVISAKKATLSVQDPLYFVEDSSSAVCIGIENSAFEGLPYIENSAIELDPSGNISAISGYSFHSDSADNATSAESASIVTDGWETGSDGRITAYNGTAFSAGKVYSGISPVYVDNENDQIGVSSKDFIANSPLYFTEYNDRVELSISGLPDTPGLMYESSFNYESGKITGYHGSAISAGKVYSGIDPVHVDNVNDTISLDSATLGVQAPLYFVEDSESATIIGLDSAQVVTPTIPVSGINGIKITESADTVFFEVSGNYVDYSAIDGTDNIITGINGSALSAGANYSAGDNIVIDNNTISVASAITLVDPVTLRILHENGKNIQFIDYSGDAGAIIDPSGLYVSDLNETAFTLVDKELVTIRNASGSVDMSNMAPGPSIDLIRMSGNTPVSNIQMHTQDHQYPEYRAYIRATDKDSATSSYNQLDLNTVDVTITHVSDDNDPALYRHYSLTGACSSAQSAMNIISSSDLTEYSAGDNIDITNHVISGKDWGSDISGASAYAYEQATAAIPAPFDPTYISGQIDNKLDSAIYAANSGTWNEVTGKLDASAVNSALRPPYGAIISGIDNIPISAKVSDSAYYAKFDENGTYLTSYLTAVPTGTMNETEFRYDSDNLIASYNGSAFAATLPASADAMLETVYRSGAVWNTVTGKLDGSASSSFYTTANESGFITGVPAGTMNESNFGYDASDNITAYNGSAFKAGGEFPQSATEAIEVVTANSADWNGTTQTVSSNSASWGGEPLPLSSRDGIDLEIDNNVLWIGASALSSIYQPITGMTAYQTVLTLETGSI